MAIAIFFVLHWQLSVFFQSFFLHRYGAHRQFEMSPRMEKVFHFLTWIVQGSSFLSPRAYAILHRLHHAYSDTPKDPHSPTITHSLHHIEDARLRRAIDAHLARERDAVRAYVEEERTGSGKKSGFDPETE